MIKSPVTVTTNRVKTKSEDGKICIMTVLADLSARTVIMNCSAVRPWKQHE